MLSAHESVRAAGVVWAVGTEDQVEPAGEVGVGGPHPGPLPEGEGVDAKVADRDRG